MRIMVVGGGGREHAIIRKIRENPRAERIYALPGNGGIGAEAVRVPVQATDLPGIRAFALSKGIDFAVIGPDNPLAMGAVDLLEEAGIPCFGPTKAAAEIESSKVFAKGLMRKYGIPTADYRVFGEPGEAMDYIRDQRMPMVIKADGLALGKGVLICESPAEAEGALKMMMEDRAFGDSGARVVAEEFLTGPEVSVLTFTDGETLIPMVSSMDHKRIGEGDTGLNTGGMGAIAPNPFYTPEIAERCMREIFLPTIRAMKAEGRPFSGCLYFGLMLTDDGPKVIEYNCRFGDPETQAVLPLLESDLLEIMLATREGRLGETPVVFSGNSTACVVMASKGYPAAYEKGKEIRIGDTGRGTVFHAGTDTEDGKLVTSGGRVLCVTAVSARLPDALAEAYAGVESISFDGAVYRHDIGLRALGK
jgi:phosphoribosylamine--glycine ligase